MKVVINKCYGGFSLSSEGLAAYASRKGITTLYFFRLTYDRSRPVYTPIEGTPAADETGMIMAYTSPDRDDESHYSPYRIEDRSDPDLVAVVEELGPRANGRHAALAVVEVPDDVAWTIEEYDGIEWVAEQHRTWS